MHGHYNFECQTNLNRNGGRKYNFIEKEYQSSLLMASYMNEKNHQNLWYINIRCCNNMSRDKSLFSDFDKSYQDFIKSLIRKNKW